MRAHYAACVSFIDFWVGQVLDALERLGLREHTLVLYVADHGEYLGDHFAYGKRGFHDPPCRIPFILSWPGMLPQGEVRHHLVGLEDVLPTCVAAADSAATAGATATPSDVEGVNGVGDRMNDGVDGTALLGPARDATIPGRTHLIGQLAEKALGLYAVVEDEWKYVFSAPDNREYLIYRGRGEGAACDRSECADHAGEPGAQPVLERLRATLVERFRRDGYEDALDPADPAGLRRYPRRTLAWEPLDEMEDRSVVARGWQFAGWNRAAPFDTPEFDHRKDPAKGAFRFASRDVLIGGRPVTTPAGGASGTPSPPERAPTTPTTPGAPGTPESAQEAPAAAPADQAGR
jgi:arylsulfatase A-like enzyme